MASIVAATVITLLVLDLTIGWGAVVPLIVAVVVTALAGLYFARRIGGCSPATGAAPGPVGAYWSQ